MSKSNKHHCTPEELGKQKGDFSPFFHIRDKEELREILLNERKEASYISEEEIEEFGIFFHKGTRDAFLKKAAEELKKRQALALEIRSQIVRLSEEIAALAQSFSTLDKSEQTPAQDCALLAETVEKKETRIRMNFLFPLNNHLILLKESNTFFQIEKEALLYEAALKSLGSDLKEWSILKEDLLAEPPHKQISLLSQILNQYEAIEHYVASQLISAAKAAKEKNIEKYNNLRYNTALHLCDVANAMKHLS